MINFNFESVSVIFDGELFSNWISSVIIAERKQEGDINYIFCNDEYLLKLNLEFLKHDTLTDVISFDYTVGNIISGDVFVSLERVHENASLYNVSFNDELKRVIVHGILHFCGYKDKTTEDQLSMRDAEDCHINSFHVKHNQ